MKNDDQNISVFRIVITLSPMLLIFGALLWSCVLGFADSFLATYGFFMFAVGISALVFVGYMRKYEKIISSTEQRGKATAIKFLESEIKQPKTPTTYTVRAKTEPPKQEKRNVPRETLSKKNQSKATAIGIPTYPRPTREIFSFLFNIYSENSRNKLNEKHNSDNAKDVCNTVANRNKALIFCCYSSLSC